MFNTIVEEWLNGETPSYEKFVEFHRLICNQIVNGIVVGDKISVPKIYRDRIRKLKLTWLDKLVQQYYRKMIKEGIITNAQLFTYIKRI
jgi:hypothetical protein